MKTEEELNALKKEVKMMQEKLAQLTEEELKQVTGGAAQLTPPPELPATELEGSTYNGMFKGCEGLTSAPDLPVQTLRPGAYQPEELQE